MSDSSDRLRAHPALGRVRLGCILHGAVLFAATVAVCRGEAVPLPTAVHSLDSLAPIRIPTHPEVTTTVVFPDPIGTPDGAGFTEDPAVQAGDYRVGWQPGERHLSIVPLQGERGRNLNVPCAGELQVLIFEPAGKAEAKMLVRIERREALDPGRLEVVRSPVPPADRTLPATASRLLGLMDRLKLLHAAPPGERREAVVRSLRDSQVAAVQARAEVDSVIGELVLVIRDARIDALGFAVVLTNRGKTSVRPDPRGWSVRAGAAVFKQVISDTPAELPAGSTKPAYFVIQGESGIGRSHLAAANAWELRFSLESNEPPTGGAAP